MGRISILLAAISLLVLGHHAVAQEIRQVAPGITIAPGLPEPAKPKQAEKKDTAKIETSKSQATTYGAPVAPVLPVEAKIEAPQPSQPPVSVKSAEKPAPVPGIAETTRPVAASPAATPQPANPVAQSEQKVATAAREEVRSISAKREMRELKVGDRIPDDAQLYNSPPRRQADRAPIRVGDRIPDDVQLYDLPRSAVR